MSPLDTAAALVGVSRPAFLLLTPACVLLGFATAVDSPDFAGPWRLVLVLAGALAAHVSANVFNEYLDFRSGLDFRTQRTPFSGGSGTLPAHPEMAQAALVLAWAALVVCALIGLWLVYAAGPGLIPVGLLGIAIIYFYTTWVNRRALVSLIAPGLGFGPLMVAGTHYALTGGYSSAAATASLVPFFLVSNLLLLNQFPDLEADRSVGRRHLPILLGRPSSSQVFGAFLAFAYVSLIIGVATGALAPVVLLGLLPAPLAAWVYVGVRRHADEMGVLVKYMGWNAVVTLITPMLIAAGLLIG
jgi:1,4-dihydroxy-2-naphthoate octaprenyltransferase